MTTRFHSNTFALSFHLAHNFYPPLPMAQQQAFMRVFREYWAGDLDLTELQEHLRDEAGYLGELHQYDFWQFLNDEDLSHG